MTSHRDRVLAISLADDIATRAATRARGGEHVNPQAENFFLNIMRKMRDEIDSESESRESRRR
jgi:hypothetical protein